MPEEQVSKLLMEILEKRDEAKKYMESYKKLMKDCDIMILKLKDNLGWEVE
jgi:nucleoside 2-deoxyribosyltransferase|tara:strand:- start:3613 stop:3765 length:153 start_codon:yes stop_codon:yes gene_type:complete